MRVQVKPAQINRITMLLCGLAICAGVYVRDVLGVGVSKYLLLVFAVIPLVVLPLEYVVVFSAFLIPLYVGMPGNYITLFLLLRFVYELCVGKIKCNAGLFFSSIGLFFYIFCSNWIYKDTAVYNIVGSLDFVLLALIAVSAFQLGKVKDMIFAFAVSSAFLGMLMLSTTLQYYTLAELMSESSRLGYTGMLADKVDSSMVVSIDPNFYGMHVIALLSTAYIGLSVEKGTIKKWLTLLCMVVSVSVCLIGLSRAFAICLVVWLVLVVVRSGNVKSSVAILVATTLLVLCFCSMFPEVVEGIERRFQQEDLIEGNGRIRLIIKNYDEWQESIGKIVFGGGLYNNNTHCTPLLYLFGMGLIGTLLLVCWFVSVVRASILQQGRKERGQYIPFVVTFAMFSSIPAAGAINYTFPLLISILAISVIKGDVDRVQTV